MEYEDDSYINCNWSARDNPQSLGIENRTSRDYSNNNFVKIGQHTVKSPGDLRRLAVWQTPVKDHLLKLMENTLKE